MKWKDILIGSSATLLVTILAGIVVYYLTVQQPAPMKELLVYGIEPVASFESDATKLAVLNIRISNLGTAAAHNVRASITMNSLSRIRDKSVYVSTGKVSGLNIDSSSENQVRLFISSLIPGERMTVSLLLSPKPGFDPEILVKSDASLGVPESTMPGEQAKEESFIEKSLPFLLILLGLFQLPLLYAYYRIRRSKSAYPSNLNNNAFVLLHQGLNERAEVLLLKGIESGELGPFVLGSYGLALALRDEFDQAIKYIKAAEFYARVTRTQKQ